MIEIKNLKKYFPIKSGFFNSKSGDVKAVESVTFDIPEGEILGLVGESGSGKTTLGRSIIRLIEPSEGEIFYNNKNILNFNEKDMRSLRKDFQIIFQDPYASLDPRKKIVDIISQGLKIHTTMNKQEIYNKVKSIIKEVGLQEEHLNRYPHEFSGGQRQRIGIARALVLDPKFIIADEPVSALDVTIQAQILNLILELKEKYSLTILFISHDLSVINQIADRVMVMYLGHIVEVASTKNLFSNPRHPYTKSLIETAPQIFRKNENKILLKGDKNMTKIATMGGNEYLQFFSGSIVNTDNFKTGNHSWYTADGKEWNERMILTSEGRLGIGTNKPDEVLHVNGGIKVNGIILGGTSIKVTADKINLLKNLKSEAQEQIDNIIELQKVYENKLETKLKEKDQEIARINSKYADLERRLIEIENKLNN